MQLDERFRCELTSLVWLLSLATAGNLLAISSDQTLVYARNLVKVCASVLSTQFRFGIAPATSMGCLLNQPSERAVLTCPLVNLPADAAHPGYAAGSR